ncbi:uncharacterized protein EV420DRAFT_312617 [Desarmillaria tabescens]|uniref:Secreted protein n=1 Tax=Armillaria tabescens TaxID=1929756 RepID=A0AA39KG08_ARMTA|nr:uncharacterized protein EV420DRAFT_312617 [Desarmillaria tabescens]KAK0459270.1 hypothetical protein EV420DRAFT_312617 [Desarmillaria tabescens]
MKFAFFVVFIGTATAICPGFNFGIADTHGGPPGSCTSNSSHTYSLILTNTDLAGRVYDNSCNTILTVFADNPCTQGAFGCSPAPITFNKLHLNGVYYNCSRETNSEKCEQNDIQVCCK